MNKAGELIHVSAFSGYEGFGLGFKIGGLKVRTIAYVENNEYCQETIKARIKEGLLDDGAIFSDIRSFRGEQFRGLVDIFTAGFPCQPHSTAGKRAGIDDPRNLWPETLRTIRAIRPRWVLLENVEGINQATESGSPAEPSRPAYALTVVGDLARIGYDCRWGFVPAAAVGAPHLRWRWWCLAYPNAEHDGLIAAEIRNSVMEGSERPA